MKIEYSIYLQDTDLCYHAKREAESAEEVIKEYKNNTGEHYKILFAEPFDDSTNAGRPNRNPEFTDWVLARIKNLKGSAEPTPAPGPRKPVPKIPYEVFVDKEKFKNVDYMAAVRDMCKGTS